MNPKPGEVWLVDLGLAAKTRPIVIVSRYDTEPPRALVLYIPVTTQNRGSAYEVELPNLPFLRQGSVANVQGLGSVPSVRLERKLGELSEETMLEIKQALMFALDLGAIVEQDTTSNPDYM
ncbi:MAG: type II toxin-antitoxin system PemK/MazF family toxin [Cyanosarcina radialis HA8281-LM2]|jgi:mRNA interferase MazF|nr:type II toxin-antitoxin system PemK/MazF family toxin [Cyanosarcina radialis HA8281-LM2]